MHFAFLLVYPYIVLNDSIQKDQTNVSPSEIFISFSIHSFRLTRRISVSPKDLGCGECHERTPFNRQFLARADSLM